FHFIIRDHRDTFRKKCPVEIKEKDTATFPMPYLQERFRILLGTEIPVIEITRAQYRFIVLFCIHQYQSLTIGCVGDQTVFIIKLNCCTFGMNDLMFDLWRRHQTSPELDLLCKQG